MFLEAGKETCTEATLPFHFPEDNSAFPLHLSLSELAHVQVSHKAWQPKDQGLSGLHSPLPTPIV